MKCSIKKITILLALVFIVSSIGIPCFAENTQRWNLGSTINTGKDNGYSGNNDIDRGDPHYGWNLGQFYVSGYTQRTNDSQNSDVFLKNVGDQVELHFELLQDIDNLNGNANLSIYADDNGYDQYFGTQQFNDCRGLLIIRKTDYQNATADPVIYTNYLDGVAQGADTVVELCEEGDYEVALDYEIKEDHYGVDWNTYISIPTYTNYRIFFRFKIRNGNCMVFPFDVANGSELTNESFTDNGFYLDLANSRYLDINVKRSVYVEGSNGYTEDIRFNRPAADGTQYTDEGVYTITVQNNFTNQQTVKTIYVGTDPMMRAFVVSGYTLDEIEEMVGDGYSISENGDMIAPSDDVDSDEDDTKETNIDKTSEDKSDSDTSKKAEKKTNLVPIIVAVVVIVVVGAGVCIFLMRNKLFGKKNNVSNAPKASENVPHNVPSSADETPNESSSVDESSEDKETMASVPSEPSEFSPEEQNNDPDAHNEGE
ncbi:MAG: hypothetical protein K6A80_08355 [Saccharofermentans sp.]|nr:hypothetical protein [Saccharofermentans sp.]